MEALRGWFSNDAFMPHGHCFLWQPTLLWLMVATNALIGVSYVLISGMLAGLVHKIRDLPFKFVYLAFGLFIVSCGVTHFMDIWVIWEPRYWLDGSLRVVTALASVTTALMLPPMLPRAMSLARTARAAHQRGVALQTALDDLEKLYERRIEIEAAKANFFANVSHELRTPLTLILGPLEALLADTTLRPEQLRELTVIERNAHLLLGHVNDLLDVAKLDADKLTLAYTVCDLAGLLNQVAGHFEALARLRNIDLRVETPHSAEATLDTNKVQRVVLNLLSNAFKFTPPGGSIVCTVGGDEDNVWLCVTDTGPGVPEAERQHIFSRFAQVEGQSSRGQSGTGLGLSIVRDFAELHGGTAVCETGSRGGARFKVTLPRRASDGASVSSADTFDDTRGLQDAVATPAAWESATPDAPDAPDAQEDAADRSVVVVVEDNADLRTFVCQSLAESYDVRSAANGREGYALARQVHPDLVISDIMMPEMSGPELLQALRTDVDLSDVPLLFLSAKMGEAERVALLRAGAQDYVTKPFGIGELRARTANLVSLERTRRVLQEAVQSRDQNMEQMALQLRARSRELQRALVEARAAQERAEHLSRAKSDFVNMVSHELRTPLTAIELQLMRLQRQQKSLQPQQLVILEQMRASSSRLAGLIESMLQYNRLDQGELRSQCEAFDLATVVADVVAESAAQAQLDGLTVTCEAVPSVRPKLYSDPLLVRLIVSNLLSNAVKFTPSGGSVAVRTECRGEQFVVEVRDTGPGIREEDQAQIFEPFVHLEPVANKHTPGVGLGLSLVRSMLQALGGRVEVVSQLGEGATFRIYLQADGSAAAAANRRTPPV